MPSCRSLRESEAVIVTPVIITQVIILLTTGMQLLSGIERNAGATSVRAVVNETMIETMIAGTGMNVVIADQTGMSAIKREEIGIGVVIILTENLTQKRILRTRAAERMSLIVGSTALDSTEQLDRMPILN